MSKRVKVPVVSIHGIHSDGEWQHQLAPLLHPHFDYIPYGYNEYRWDGAIRIFLGRWWPVYLASSVYAAHLWGPTAFALLPVTLVACHLHARALRNAVKGSRINNLDF